MPRGWRERRGNGWNDGKRIAMMSIFSRSRLILCAALLGLSGMLTACSEPSALPDTSQPLRGPLTLQSGDRVRVNVWGQDQITGEYLVERDGTIALPLVGRVPVTNRTPHEAEAAVADRLRDGFVIDPKVTMDVIQFRPIYVVGEVTHPGAYDYASNINVINAVAMAGGFTTRAKKDSITVVRGAEPNRTKFTASDNTQLLPGDVVTVPE